VIHWVTLRAFVAATEDEERVKEALCVFVPRDSIKSTSVEGFYGNEIKILEATLLRKDGLEVFQTIKDLLPRPELARLQKELPERTDQDGKFHLRLDKQAMFKGRLGLTDSRDAVDICAHIATYPARYDEALRILSELLR
jgi:RNA binding exosome subunit